jgi:hypothetical protein
MNFDTINEQFLSAFPFCRAAAASKFSYFGDDAPGAYVFFGDFAVPMLNALITIGAAVVQREHAASFLNDMAACDDGRVEDLFVEEVVPVVLNNSAFREAYWPLAGEQAKRWIRLKAPVIAPDVTLLAD